MSNVDQDRARQVIADMERKTEVVTQKLWFFDLKFSQFATPRLIGFVFLLYLLLACVGCVTFAGYAMLHMPLLHAVASIAAYIIAAIISAILVRVFLEAFLVVFRIAESLQYLKTIAEKP